MTTRTMPERVERAHTEVSETLSIFAVASPTGVGGSLQLWWHRFGKQPPLFEANCGASIMDEPPVRMNLIHRACADCRVTTDEVAEANTILKNVRAKYRSGELVERRPRKEARTRG